MQSHTEVVKSVESLDMMMEEEEKRPQELEILIVDDDYFNLDVLRSIFETNFPFVKVHSY